MDHGILISMLALGACLIGHVVTTVWWASKITTILESAQKSLTELMMDMKSVNTTYVTQKEFVKEISRIDKSNEAMWVKVDHLSEKIK